MAKALIHVMALEFVTASQTSMVYHVRNANQGTMVTSVINVVVESMGFLQTVKVGLTVNNVSQT